MFEENIFRQPQEIVGIRNVLTYQGILFDTVIFQISYEDVVEADALKYGRSELSIKLKSLLSPDWEF